MGATNQARDVDVTATFSRAMDPVTLNGSTFTLTGPSGPALAGTISYNATTRVATLNPTSDPRRDGQK